MHVKLTMGACARALMAKVIHIWCERAVGLYGSACVQRECRRKGHPRAAGGSLCDYQLNL
jgi:hypothetical protein